MGFDLAFSGSAQTGLAEWTGGPVKILVVEDDSRVAAFINRGLREEGHVVDVAGGAEDGLSHAYISRYDVIVIDVMLPPANVVLT